MGKIVIIDDEQQIAELISDTLQDEGFETVVFNDGESAISYINKNYSSVSLVTIDIMMPGKSGYEVCKTIRGKISSPIIFISAKGKSTDTIYGLDIGADDYISKPFVVNELVARIKAHLRREERTCHTSKFKDVLVVGGLELNKSTFKVTKDGEVISISTREFQLLQYLMENSGKVLSREEIFRHVWNTEYGDIGTVAVNIKNLRDKIDPDNQYIRTVWGVGYKIVDARR